MLFYTDTDNIRNIPKSFTKIIVTSNASCKNIAGCMTTPMLVPTSDMIDIVDGELEEKYYFRMLENESHMSVIVLMMMAIHNGKDVVILATRKENKTKFLKKLGKFISKRYEYPVYKFKSMDDITMEMRSESVVNDYCMSQIEYDVLECKAFIDHCIETGESI